MSLELLTPAEMTRVDAAAPDEGASGSALMERAGGAVAAEVANGWPDARRILVLAGPGNNGGDGFVAARKLAEAGREVLVALLGEREGLKGDAAVAAARWTGETGPLPNAPFEACDLVIDALFGAGLGRPIEGAAADAVSAANASGLLIVSVDVPSGLDGATGRPLGDACVRAAVTVTFVRLKPGHVLTPGRSLCGRVVLADIGMPEDAIAGIGARAFLNRPALWRDQLPAPSIEGHKYSRGHVAVWSGPELSTGAARLSALAALRAGAGAVTLLGQRAALKEHAAHLTAVMLREAENGWAEFLAQRRVSAVVVGPAAGPTERTAQALTEAIEAGCHVVMDADVFSLFAGRPDDLAVLIARGSGQVVLTPHEGEFARVFGVDKTASKLERTRAAAARSGATVLLKGADTVVATPDGRATVADNAPPYLATAGAGDVLAGLCAGLLAQGAPAFEAASAAVWLHGEAATAVGRGLIADDLPGAIPEALRRMEERAAG